MSGNPIDSINTTGNQSKSYAQIPPGARITGSASSGILSDSKITRSSYRSSTNQNRESNNVLSSHTSINTSGKTKKLTTDMENSTNVIRLTSHSKQSCNEVIITN